MRSMSRLVVLALVTLAAVAAAWYTGRPPSAVEHAGETMFPRLLERINDAARVEVVHQGEHFTIERASAGWQVKEKGGYPADGQALRTLLIGAARLIRVEPKTARAERYVKLGLGDPGDHDSKSVELRLLDAGGEALADLIVGERRLGNGDPNVDEYFVRQPGEARSWLVVGKLPAARAVADWLDKSVAAIEHERVRRVSITHPDGEVVTVARERDGNDYRLQAIPAGRKVDGDWKVNDIGRALEELKLEDVLPAADAGFDQAAPGPRLELTTYDGLRVTLRAARDGERTLAELDASFDPALVEPPSQSSAGAGESTASAQSAAADGSDAPPAVAAHDADAVRT